MTPRGFVYSGDAKTLDAVRLIFEQLSVEFDQCSTRAEAVGLISKQHFDAVLVDCSEVQDATQIFNALRSSGSNQNTMTIAIVDGKSGVPTAFRLGAKMVMSKPLSLEQARSTLRNALALQKKETQEPKAAGAAVGIAATPLSPAMQATVASGPAVVPKPETTKANTGFTNFRGPSAPLQTPAANNLKDAESASDDKSAAQEELEAAEREIATGIASAPPATPSFGMLEPPAKKSNPMLFVALGLVAVGGGLYFAWSTQPNLRNQAIAKFANAKSAVASHRADTPTQAPPPETPTEEKPPIADGFVDPSVATQELPPTQDPSAAPPVAASSTASTSDSATADLVTVPEDLADAHVTYRVPPVMPENVRSRTAKGTVTIMAKVNADGTVGSYTVLSGQPQFTPAAIDAVRQWKYQPYYHNGQPSGFQTQITIQFPPQPAAQ